MKFEHSMKRTISFDKSTAFSDSGRESETWKKGDEMNTDILARLEYLERSNRRLKLVISALVAGGLLGALSAAGPRTSFDSIVANEIHINRRLTVGEEKSTQRGPSTTVAILTEKGLNDPRLTAFISVTNSAGGVLTLAASHTQHPTINVMAQENNDIQFFEPTWVKKKF